MSTVRDAVLAIHGDIAALSNFSPDNVVVTAGMTLEAFEELNYPCALIVPGESNFDQENPEFEELTVDVGVWVQDERDPWGHSAILEETNGVLALLEAIKTAFVKFDRVDGVRWHLTGWSRPRPEMKDGTVLVHGSLSYRGVVG